MRFCKLRTKRTNEVKRKVVPKIKKKDALEEAAPT